MCCQLRPHQVHPDAAPCPPRELRLGSCAGAELEVIREHRPFEPFQWLPKTLHLDFAEGIKMLQAAGREVCSQARAFLSLGAWQP